MDDVGQTLLNWASAFGTQEMVKAQAASFPAGSTDVNRSGRLKLDIPPAGAFSHANIMLTGTHSIVVKSF